MQQTTATAAADDTEPRGYGTPTLTSEGREVLEVHLHRYLAPWLHQHQVAEINVLVGFEGTAVPPVTFAVTADGARLSDLSVSFDSLTAAARADAESVALVPGESQQQLAAVPCLEQQDDQDVRHYCAFVLVDPATAALRDDAHRNDLAHRTSEALRSSRHNALRIIFDQGQGLPIKDFIYEVLDRLPEWCGVDHSAALILTGSLETMALNSTKDAEFEVVSERLYYPRHDEDGRVYERLVGLVIEGEEDDAGLLGFAFKQVQKADGIGLHIFVPDDLTRKQWHLFGEAEKVANRFATRVHRPQEGMSVLVPLLSKDALGNSEMLGFFALNFRKPVPIGAVASGLIQALSSRLAGYLLRSPLFSLSARQLLVLEQVRKAYNATIGMGGARKRLNHFVDQVSDLICKATGVPTFAIGYITMSDRRRLLRFMHPRGFTRFSTISLPVEAPQEVSETSVAALAVRLDRPLVLSGGRQATEHKFKNDIYVNETEGLLVDARRIDPEEVTTGGHWRLLSEYYKPSREQSYATLAFPVSLGREVLGVIAVEVDRNTDWLWWTGFGSQIFYRLLANELAVGFKLMGVPNL